MPPKSPGTPSAVVSPVQPQGPTPAGAAVLVTPDTPQSPQQRPPQQGAAQGQHAGPGGRPPAAAWGGAGAGNSPPQGAGNSPAQGEGEYEWSISQHCDPEHTASAPIEARIEMGLQTQGTFCTGSAADESDPGADTATWPNHGAAHAAEGGGAAGDGDMRRVRWDDGYRRGRGNRGRLRPAAPPAAGEDRLRPRAHTDPTGTRTSPGGVVFVDADSGLQSSSQQQQQNGGDEDGSSGLILPVPQPFTSRRIGRDTRRESAHSDGSLSGLAHLIPADVSPEVPHLLQLQMPSVGTDLRLNAAAADSRLSPPAQPAAAAALDQAARQVDQPGRHLLLILRRRDVLEVENPASVAAFAHWVSPLFEVPHFDAAGAGDEAEGPENGGVLKSRSRGRRGRQSPSRMRAATPQPHFVPMSPSARAHPLTGGECWIDIQGAGEGELKQLGGLLHLDDLTIEDVILEDCPEKLESFSERPIPYQYGLLRAQWSDAHGTAEQVVSCILFPRYELFVTIHKGPAEGIAELCKRVRWEFARKDRARAPDHARPPPGHSRRAPPRKMHPLWLFYGLLDAVVDCMIPRTIAVAETARDMDDLVVQLCGAALRGSRDVGRESGEMEDLQQRMGSVRRHIMELRRTVVSKEMLIKKNQLDSLATFRDVQDHLTQMLERLDNARDVLTQAASNHLSHASFEAAIGANETNEVMKKLSILASVFVPMTLVCSMFGMNVKVPWQDVNSTRPFWAILGSFAVLAALFFVVFSPQTCRDVVRQLRR
eukprot:TRINITY_DN43120_c0_g1_i2.p1 TRINITY_DN43120_c0_g1~~TRINITY_DN43120_c0_g1_i2.p1  ORF type:complete len:794 (+),score=231.96 TRINITY_DN43120_c0_g1_i2:87-2384(+)